MFNRKRPHANRNRRSAQNPKAPLARVRDMPRGGLAVRQGPTSRPAPSFTDARALNLPTRDGFTVILPAVGIAPKPQAGPPMPPRGCTDDTVQISVIAPEPADWWNHMHNAADDWADMPVPSRSRRALAELAAYEAPHPTGTADEEIAKLYTVQRCLVDPMFEANRLARANDARFARFAARMNARMLETERREQNLAAAIHGYSTQWDEKDARVSAAELAVRARAEEASGTPASCDTLAHGMVASALFRAELSAMLASDGPVTR